MLRWIDRQIEEIESDSALRWYGAALALVNAITAIYWLIVHPIARILDPRLTPICWPLIPNCQALRLLNPVALNTIVVTLLCAAVCNAALFISPRSVRSAYWLLLSLCLLKAALIV